MLFDLKGKRRRTVQVTYVALAFLMAAGLIGAGIGSGTNGGLFDLFGSGGGSGNDVIDKKIESAQKALRRNPKDGVALRSLVRAHYALAGAHSDQRTGRFDKEGKKELGKASAAWQRYLATDPKKPDVALAGSMVNAYSPTALNQPANATTAAEIVATDRDDAVSWLQLAQLAQLAHQTRKAELAGKRALDRAPKKQRKLVKKQVDQLKRGASGAGAATTTAPGG